MNLQTGRPTTAASDRPNNQEVSEEDASQSTPTATDKLQRPQTDKQDIRRFLDLIMVEDGIIEVRAMDVPSWDLRGEQP